MPASGRDAVATALYLPSPARETMACKSNGCLARGEAARLWHSLRYEDWVKATGYGMRWKCECVFSDLKRIFPETVTARSKVGIIRQLFARAETFNGYKAVRAGMIGVTGNGVVLTA